MSWFEIVKELNSIGYYCIYFFIFIRCIQRDQSAAEQCRNSNKN